MEEFFYTLPDNVHKNILQDVWQYEVEKHSFVSNMPTADEYQLYRKEQSLITNAKLDGSFSEIVHQHIGFGKNFSSIESRLSIFLYSIVHPYKQYIFYILFKHPQ